MNYIQGQLCLGHLEQFHMWLIGSGQVKLLTSLSNIKIWP